MILLLAAPVSAAPPRSPEVLSLLAGPRLAAPVNDVVAAQPGAASARISASASAQRYPVNDGSDATVEIAVTAGCATACDAADPQPIANFIGTLAHGYEIELLTVQLDTPFQLGLDCGFEAEACYYSGENKMVISGDDWAGIDGATREFVIAHEYGHHLAQHRENPAPFPAAIDWGPPRWASQERVCQGWRTGRFFPEEASAHYYSHPGEAFAEAFAHYHFPQAPVQWRWNRSLKPTPAAFEAIREDALSPWWARQTLTIRGRFPARGSSFHWLPTPLDGRISLRPSGLRRRGYRVVLRSSSGRVLRTSRHGLGPQRRLDYTVCGQSRLGIAIKPTRRSAGVYRLQIQRP
jgi:hypothetical protein